MKEYSYQATHKSVSKLDTPYKRVYASLKAMSNLIGYDCGTLRNPVELASSTVYLYEMPGSYIKAASLRPFNAVKEIGKCNLIEAVFKGYEVEFNDGWHIFEIDEEFMYVDYTGIACREMKANDELDNYTIYDECMDDEEIAQAIAEGSKIKKNTYKVVLD